MKKRSVLLFVIFITPFFTLTAKPGTAITILSSNIQAEVQAGEDARLSFDFDDDGANANNGWIEIYFDGKLARFCAGTTLEAPFSFEVPGQILKNGEHTVEFKILSRDQGEDTTLTRADVLLKIVE